MLLFMCMYVCIFLEHYVYDMASSIVKEEEREKENEKKEGEEMRPCYFEPCHLTGKSITCCLLLTFLSLSTVYNVLS